MVEFGETPVDESHLALGVINHDIMRFYIAMDDSLRVTEIQSFEDFKHVESYVEVSQLFVKSAEVVLSSFNILHDLSE